MNFSPSHLSRRVPRPLTTSHINGSWLDEKFIPFIRQHKLDRKDIFVAFSVKNSENENKKSDVNQLEDEKREGQREKM